MSKQNKPVEAGSSMTKIIAIGFNQGGIDEGELDYSIAGFRADALSESERKRFLVLMKDAENTLKRQWGMETLEDQIARGE